MSSIYHNPTPYNRSCKCCGTYRMLHYFDMELCGFSVCSDCVVHLEEAADVLQASGLVAPTESISYSWDKV